MSRSSRASLVGTRSWATIEPAPRGPARPGGRPVEGPAASSAANANSRYGNQPGPQAAPGSGKARASNGPNTELPPFVLGDRAAATQQPGHAIDRSTRVANRHGANCVRM